MEQQLKDIKAWLGVGSVNIFGLPMSGKDTVGVRLAENLGAKFLSSGMIVRAMEKEKGINLSGQGSLIPSNTFYEWILPYFEREDLWNYPLILSSIGRWAGEEDEVMAVARSSGHTIRAAVELRLSEQDVVERWEAAKLLGDRGLRPDDANPDIFRKRIEEYRNKTLPVLKHYQELGLLVSVPANLSRDQVFAKVVEALANFSKRTHNFSPVL
jgi:adenylate kinase